MNEKCPSCGGNGTGIDKPMKTESIKLTYIFNQRAHRRIEYLVSKTTNKRSRIVYMVRWYNHIIKGCGARIGRQTRINQNGKSYRFYYVAFSKKGLERYPLLHEVMDYGKQIQP